MDIAINRDHIHVLFYTKIRESQIRFLRLTSAEIGRKYKIIRKQWGASKGELWTARPFTRLVSWGKKSLDRVKKYFRQNRDEAMGFVEYKPRKQALSLFLAKWEHQQSSSA